ncbi:biotin/lipoate--protein ligase family protein [Roseivivax sp. CAU 1761]
MIADAAPVFPPLLEGRAVPGDPFAAAIAAAQAGAEPGLVLYRAPCDDLEAALVLAPEVALAEAAQMLPLAGVALQNALGALAPPEVPVDLGWEGGVWVNDGRAGTLRAAAPSRAPDAVPDWLVIGLSLRFVPPAGEGGATPDITALHAEGCGDLAPLDLLESWSRHFLVWLHGWEETGAAALHRDLSALLRGRGGCLTALGVTGRHVGLDERLGLLLKTGEETRLLPLTDLLETP